GPAARPGRTPPAPRGPREGARGIGPAPSAGAAAGRACCGVLFFGEIKPHRGLALLLGAIAAVPADRRARIALTVAGRPRMAMEPLQAFAREHGIEATWDLRFIADHEIGGLFAATGGVALPHHDVDSSRVLSLAIGARQA